MKKLTTILCPFVVAALAAMGFGITAGCEAQSSREAVIITPSTATVKKGQSVSFTASGGHEYWWELKYEGWGTLSTKRGPTTVYTALVTPGVSNAVLNQVLTCISVIPGTPEPSSETVESSTDTNNTTQATEESYQVRGTADITHLP